MVSTGIFQSFEFFLLPRGSFFFQRVRGCRMDIPVGIPLLLTYFQVGVSKNNGTPKSSIKMKVFPWNKPPSILGGKIPLFLGWHPSRPQHSLSSHWGALRSTPDLLVMRPADANEVVEMWKCLAPWEFFPLMFFETKERDKKIWGRLVGWLLVDCWLLHWLLVIIVVVSCWLLAILVIIIIVGCWLLLPPPSPFPPR